ALDRAGHTVKQLELEPCGIDAELIRDGLRVRDTADVMRSKRRRNNGGIFKKYARKLFEVRVAFWFLKKDRRIRSVLARFRCLVIPICAFHQSDCEASAACVAPLHQVAQVAL